MEMPEAVIGLVSSAEEPASIAVFGALVAALEITASTRTNDLSDTDIITAARLARRAGRIYEQVCQEDAPA